jgi:hypothetical protein
MFMTLPSELPGFAVWKASRGRKGARPNMDRAPRRHGVVCRPFKVRASVPSIPRTVLNYPRYTQRTRPLEYEGSPSS